MPSRPIAGLVAFARLIAAVAGVVLATPLVDTTVLAQRGRSTCGAALETINWARERLARPDLTTRELSQVLSLLELSTQNCATNGDLWYYRSLVERKLGSPTTASDYSMRKAAEWRSDALARKADPFAPPSVASAPLGPVARKWALVVGIGEFADRNLVPLRYTVKDAQDFERALLDPDTGRFDRSRIRTLVDQDATLANVRTGIGWLRANAEPEDLVVVYIASHGSPRHSDPNGVSYVMMHDTQTDEAERLYGSALQMIDLAEVLSRDLRAGRVVLVLDTCYSGDAARGRAEAGISAFAPGLEGFAGTPGRTVLAAATGDQISWESDERRNGYFTHFMLDALRRSRGQWALPELFEDVRTAVSTAVQRERGREQTPVMSGAADAKTLVLGVAEAGSTP